MSKYQRKAQASEGPSVVNIREASKIKTEEIIRYITDRIDAGEWSAGHRLPTETQISELFSAARNTVRKALGQLESDGTIVRQVGRGTFVGAAEQGVEQSLGVADVSPADINEIRVLLEPSIAELVVARATRADITYARECLQKMLSAKAIKEFEHWDAELHATIIGAAKNQLLGKIYDAIHQARQRMEWYEIKRRSIDDQRRADYDDQHTAIVVALERRDAIALRQALAEHLQAVSSNMLNPVR